jgi:hypothetical protein
VTQSIQKFRFVLPTNDIPRVGRNMDFLSYRSTGRAKAHTTCISVAFDIYRFAVSQEHTFVTIEIHTEKEHFLTFWVRLC